MQIKYGRYDCRNKEQYSNQAEKCWIHKPTFRIEIYKERTTFRVN